MLVHYVHKNGLDKGLRFAKFLGQKPRNFLSGLCVFKIALTKNFEIKGGPPGRQKINIIV